MHNNEEFENLEELKKSQLDEFELQELDRKDRIKKYTILGIAFLLIFIAVVAMIKVLMDSSTIPQDKIVDETFPAASQNVDEDLEELAVFDDKKDEKESEIDALLQETERAEEEAPKAKDEVESQIEELEAATAASAKIAANEETAQATTKESEAAKPAASEEPKSEPAPAQATKEEPKPAPAAAPTPAPKAAPSGAYAIQVGAFLKKDPDPKFLKKIEDLGLRYTIKTFQKDGTTIKRVYVGPYATKEAALEDLKKVRDALAPKAFVTRLR